DFSGDLLVAAGDNPYITPTELKKLIRRHRETNAKCSLSSAVFPGTPPPYGRIIRDENQQVTGVVEEVDTTQEQRTIKEVNASIYMFDNETVFPLLFGIDNNNSKGEYYLTDIIEILGRHNHRIEAVKADDYFVSIGINNRWELQEAQEKFNRQHLQQLAEEKGVTIYQPQTVTIELDVEIGRDTVIYPSTYIAAGTRIGSNCHIGPFTYLKGVRIPDNQTVRHEKREV
ncbi:MAG: bifunctional UDP-N-acetylglucosamine diphosphorylase/glucosamine-1-phosphate N-acetyltransferase GlmU, partial [bacterium]|nr:bifunctional UDP-N-acetylglucosamine diphosphorylase/glucosamine-1-phosphate N-acetyltransferase GlmU [bacterium]